jgi:hypothetical protein
VNNILSKVVVQSIKILLFLLLVLSGCIQQEDNLLYGPNNPDPWASNYKIASLDSLSPLYEYPTYEVTIYGSGFDLRAEDYNFVWFGTSKALVLGVWNDSLKVEVPIPRPLNYFFTDTVEVIVGLQGSYEWSDVVPFIYKPMAHPYLAATYPAQHPEDKFTKPRGLTFDQENNLFLMNARLRSIYQDKPVGGDRTVFSFGGKFDGGLRFGPDGYLYAAGNGDDIIYRISADGSSYEDWISVPSPWGIDFSSSGDLFVVDNSQSDIYKIGSNKEIKKIADFDSDLKIAYCKVFDGYVYLNTKQDGYIFRFPADVDTVSRIDSIIVSEANVIADMIFDQHGNMYFTGGTDEANSVIVLYTTGEEEILVSLGAGLSFITRIEDFIYVANLDGPVYKVLILSQE